MKMVAGVKYYGLLAAFGLTMVGCTKDDQLMKKDEEITRLNAIIINYDKENRALMEALDKGKISQAQYNEEIRGKQRQIELLKNALAQRGTRHETGGLTGVQILRLQQLAQRLGGDLVGNRIQLPGDVLFATGSWAVKEGAQSTLKQIAEELKKDGFGLMVVGHTDDQPIKRLHSKGIGSNRHLSLMRALAVTNYMQATCAYPADKLLPAGWGELKPQESNSTKTGQAKNRRVDIFIDPDISNLTVQAAAIGVSAVSDHGADITGVLSDVTAAPMAGDNTSAVDVIIEK